MRCIKCQRCDLQKSKEMSKLGWGLCNLTVATFYPLGKDWKCNSFKIADDKTLQKRIDWYESK